jgi:calcineurin-like phosphoesterase family protein
MHLIRGNHDHSNRINKAIGARGWQSVSDMKHLTLPCGTMLVLCHYGMRVWNKSHHGAIQLYGHSHGNLPGDSQSCDVGVDAWGFMPVSIEMIKTRLALLPKRTEPDHHQEKPTLTGD